MTAPVRVFSACQPPDSLGPLQWDRLPVFHLRGSHPSAKPPRCRLAFTACLCNALLPGSGEDCSGPLWSSTVLLKEWCLPSPSTFSSSQLPSAASTEWQLRIPALLTHPHPHSVAWFPCAGVLRALTPLLLPVPFPVISQPFMT